MTARNPGCLAAGMVAALLCALPAGAAEPEDGRRAYDAGRFTDAMGIWSALSRQGNAEAAYGLGLLNDLGNGTPKNSQIAFTWYRLAAEAGLPAAQFNVGAMFDSGEGVAQSSQDAALWYAKAGAQGHHRAQYDLGLLYLQGSGVPRNPDAAAAWFRAAADGGLTAAADRLKILGAAPVDRPAGELTGVTPISPQRNATLILKGDKPAVELVWTAPLQPQRVHYEVQVREVGDTKLTRVAKASMTETAAVIHLSADPQFYIWNIDTVGQNGAREVGDWNWFSVGSPGQAAQSVASNPGSATPVH